MLGQPRISIIASRGSSARALQSGAAIGVGTAAVAATIAAIAAVDGGYYPRSWGWSALLFLWVAALALVLRPTTRLSRPEITFLCALTALGAWIAISSVWTTSPALTLAETQRALVYVSAAWAALLVGRRSSLPILVGGVWGATAVISAYSLSTRLFPRTLGAFDPIAGYRLSEPIGYWNALGIFAALGALLALGLVAHGRGRALPAGAAASLVVFLPTIYFTFSRGAWIALGLGLVAAMVIDPHRLRLSTALLVIGVWPALAVGLAYRSDALARVGTSLAAAADDGRRLALVLTLLAAGAAATGVGFSLGARRLRVGRRTRRAYVLALVALGLACLLAVSARYGSPPTLVERAYRGFTAPPPPIADGNLRTRLFNLSGSGRDEQWRVAWGQFKANPWLGSGAGTHERYWVRDRPYAGVVRDAHSLYLETLAELGPIGLLLLLTALGAPLVAAVAARRHPLVPAALGAYVTYLAHAAVDWDWELPAVTLAGLTCAMAMLLAAREEQRARVLDARYRRGAVAVMLALAAFALVGLVGNSALSSSAQAVQAGNWDRARDRARDAQRWAPWSSEPWELLAKAQFGSGDLPAARASFRRAIAKDSGNWNLWFYLALASEGQARENAIAEAERLNPLSPEVAALRQESGRR